ncbi:Hypothetical protein NTJ_09664 [Nesidiocoris tenuis]|uniref:Uncharacterized protein n=1 Tax=Nesidiocoris tenuis TaxID=355587 RepID=A0ABN7AXD3_9HEMI|nr:Hypothetical protein NTJ_09664 [Nesidiocoris tenuis]
METKPIPFDSMLGIGIGPEFYVSLSSVARLSCSAGGQVLRIVGLRGSRRICRQRLRSAGRSFSRAAIQLAYQPLDGLRSSVGWPFRKRLEYSERP